MSAWTAAARWIRREEFEAFARCVAWISRSCDARICDPGRYPRDALFLRTRLVSSIHPVTVRSRTAIGAACRDWFLTRVFDEPREGRASALLSTPSRRSSHRRRRPPRHPHRHPRLRQSHSSGRNSPGVSCSPYLRRNALLVSPPPLRGCGTVVPATAATVGATSSGASVARGPSGRRSASDARRFSGGAMGVRVPVPAPALRGGRRGQNGNRYW